MNRHLFIRLKRPSRTWLGSKVQSSSFGERLVMPGLPPWPALPDLLCNADKREFVGVVHFFDENLRKEARLVYEACDPTVVKLIEASQNNKPEYRMVDPHLHALEFRWSSSPANTVACAQLLCDWYYSGNSTNNGNELVAFGIPDIDDVLQSFNLLLPRIEEE